MDPQAGTYILPAANEKDRAEKLIQCHVKFLEGD